MLLQMKPESKRLRDLPMDTGGSFVGYVRLAGYARVVGEDQSASRVNRIVQIGERSFAH